MQGEDTTTRTADTIPNARAPTADYVQLADRLVHIEQHLACAHATECIALAPYHKVLSELDELCDLYAALEAVQHAPPASLTPYAASQAEPGDISPRLKPGDSRSRTPRHDAPLIVSLGSRPGASWRGNGRAIHPLSETRGVLV